MRVGDEVFECGAGVPFVFCAVNEVFTGGAAGGLLPVVRGRHGEVRVTNYELRIYCRVCRCRRVERRGFGSLRGGLRGL